MDLESLGLSLLLQPCYVDHVSHVPACPQHPLACQGLLLQGESPVPEQHMGMRSDPPWMLQWRLMPTWLCQAESSDRDLPASLQPWGELPPSASVLSLLPPPWFGSQAPFYTQRQLLLVEWSWSTHLQTSYWDASVTVRGV